MTPLRKLLLQCILVVVIGGGALELIARRDDFYATKGEWVQVLRGQGTSAQVAVAAQQILRFTRGRGLEGTLLPLSGISNETTVFCREEDEYLVYHSDRYGFSNPDRIWDEEHADIAVVGDSFAQGACVPRGSSVVDRLREGGKRVLNLGAYSNGPLVNLASLREYLPKKKPKTVFWFYVPNDLRYDFTFERASPLLMRYLEERGFSQGLADRQKEINQKLAAFLSDEKVRNESPVSRPGLEGPSYFQRTLQNWMRLPPSRAAFTVDYEGPSEDLELPLFGEVLRAAREEVNSWGGKLVFVLIPDAKMWAAERKGADTDSIREFQSRMLEIAGSNTDQVIDLYSEFRSLANPYELYTPMGDYYGHFNQSGYARMAEILKRQK